MKADVTALDWIDYDELAPPRMKFFDHGRVAKRVAVRLQVAIGTRAQAYLTESINLSETGVLVRNQAGWNLKVGDRVRVLLKGVISDNDGAEQLITMRIVRKDRYQMAMNFC